jgi:maltose alpha-D-glucosyltransferase/alpha-amylase
MFSLPGTPVIYYGDELGMGDELQLPERWPVRTCMQWSDAPSAGFSRCDEDRLIHPAIMDGQFGAHIVNAASQQRDPDSLLNWMRRLTDARLSCPELGWGEASIVNIDNPAVFLQRTNWNGNATITLHNLGERSCEVQLPLDGDEESRIVEIFGNRTYGSNRGECQICHLDGYGYRWFRLDHLSR